MTIYNWPTVEKSGWICYGSEFSKKDGGVALGFGLNQKTVLKKTRIPVMW
jgi:hypothetical protein